MKIISIIFFSILIFAAFIAAFFFIFKPHKAVDSREIVENTWRGYKYHFIDEDGRVKRPKDGDSVSEGQAYAMLRAVWMGDKETFDRCYRWTENNISRMKEKGDNLLAWHWKDGNVLDWMPASDADIDYTLSLIFADSRWKGAAPKGLEDYGKKAMEVLADVLRLEIYSSKTGRLYLLPWILDKENPPLLVPINPSYYSPAHFQVFYEYTRDQRWLELKKTAYYILNSLSKSFEGKTGKGLIPDWCSVDAMDGLHSLEGKNTGFGWEAVRVPFRVMLDYLWFNNKDARDFLAGGLSKFIEEKWKKDGIIYCEYEYDGISANHYENPLFYAAYYCSLYVSSSPYAEDMLSASRRYIVKKDDGLIYGDTNEYYVNSLAWLAEGLDSGALKNFYKETK